MAKYVSPSGIEIDTSFESAAANYDEPTVESIMKAKRESAAKAEVEAANKSAKDAATALSPFAGIGASIKNIQKTTGEQKLEATQSKGSTAEGLADTGTFETEEEARKRDFMERAKATAESYSSIVTDSDDRKTISTSTKGRTTQQAVDDALKISKALIDVNEARYVNPDGSNSVRKLEVANANLQQASQDLTDVRNKHPIIHALFGDEFFIGTGKKLNAAMRDRQLILNEISDRNITRDNASQLITNFETNKMHSISESALSDTNKDLQKENFNYVNGIFAKGIAEGKLNLNIPPEQVPAMTMRWLEHNRTGAYAAEFAEHNSTITELFKRNGIVEEISRSEDPVGSILKIMEGPNAAVPGSEVHTQATMAMQGYTSAYLKSRGMVGDKALWDSKVKDEYATFQAMDNKDRYALIGNFGREVTRIGATKGMAGLAELGGYINIASVDNAVAVISNEPTNYDLKLDPGTLEILQSTKWYANKPDKYYTQIIDNARSTIYSLPDAAQRQAIETTARSLATVFAKQRSMTVHQNKFTTDLTNVPLKFNLRGSATLNIPDADRYLELDSFGTLLSILRQPMN